MFSVLVFISPALLHARALRIFLGAVDAGGSSDMEGGEWRCSKSESGLGLASRKRVREREREDRISADTAATNTSFSGELMIDCLRLSEVVASYL